MKQRHGKIKIAWLHYNLYIEFEMCDSGSTYKVQTILTRYGVSFDIKEMDTIF